MKITYSFANEIIEIDVDEKWGNTLIELNRQEYNINHKETRRHSSLEDMDFEGNFFADDLDIPLLIEKKENIKLIQDVIKQLKPKQRDLIFALYLSNTPMSQAEYAIQLGVKESSIKQNAARARKDIKKIIEKIQKNCIP